MYRYDYRKFGWNYIMYPVQAYYSLQKTEITKIKATPAELEQGKQNNPNFSSELWVPSE